jgi:tartrate/fumarate subfamily iron-sulfur-dependent hydro-lyase alpha chain
MPEFDYDLVRDTAKELYIRALKILPADVKVALRRAHDAERHAGAKKILATMLQNIDVAEGKDLLVCQDTGIPIYKVRIGSQIQVDGPLLEKALRDGCKKATLEHPLRSSICDPLSRKMTADSTGTHVPVIDFSFLPGAGYLEIRMMPKGSGSENMTWLKMLLPADGVNGIKKFVLESILDAGGQGCPPTIVGVGIGGTAELCVKLAKEAVFRPVGTPNPDETIAALEKELLDTINMSGIGPMGLGGDTTALAVHIEAAHTHMTLNPVAVNSQCWRGERSSARIYSDGRVEFGF